MEKKLTNWKLGLVSALFVIVYVIGAESSLCDDSSSSHSGSSNSSSSSYETQTEDLAPEPEMKFTNEFGEDDTIATNINDVFINSECEE